MQIIHIWEDIAKDFPATFFKGPEPIFSGIAENLYKKFGVFRLTSDSRTFREDVCNYFLNEQEVKKCLTAIEVVFETFVYFIRADTYVNGGTWHAVQKGVEELNKIFKTHGVGYEFRESKIIRIDSGFLHTEAVVPAMTLLQEPFLTGANQEFLSAHEHFRHGRYKECLNECLKAFESAMKAICHKRQWTYGPTATAAPLIKVCQSNGLFPVFMENHLTGLRMSLEAGVPTARNKTSGHGQGVTPIKVSPEFAAYVLNLTAANILFLVTSERQLP